VAEFALKVERSPHGDFFTAIQWFFGVLIPAAMTFAVGHGALKLNARLKEDDEFRAFRLQKMPAIIELFKRVDAVIRATQEHPGTTVFELLIERDMFSRMPSKQAKRLYIACFADDLTRIVQSLRALFPEFGAWISVLEQSLQARRNQR
jgi:hypothetical protein